MDQFNFGYINVPRGTHVIHLFILFKVSDNHKIASVSVKSHEAYEYKQPQKKCYKMQMVYKLNISMA